VFRVLFLPFALFLAAFAFAPHQEPSSKTAAPPTAAPQVNPVKPTPEGLARAKKVWGYDCSMCHGDKGNGKGDVVDAMKLTMKDYTDPAALKDMTDGQLFVVIKDGKGQMPGEGDRAKPDDIWNLVILIRSMAKK
jgi:mono/diheme cytochrome c family protein